MTKGWASLVLDSEKQAGTALYSGKQEANMEKPHTRLTPWPVLDILGKSLGIHTKILTAEPGISLVLCRNQRVWNRVLVWLPP